MKKLFTLGALLLSSLVAQAQFTIEGTVKSKSGNTPIEGASIAIADLNIGATSDERGRFRIEDLAASNYTIVVSMIGFERLTRSIDLTQDLSIDLLLTESSLDLGDVVVTGTRANENSPTTYSEVSKESLEKQNLGQDLPFLLNFTPSVVATSDAGAGIGYTGIRIRGSDPTRINVTVNGVPLNDSESQGVFWVNMPDFASSTSSVQIQRGVGTSTNGAGAFGASVNILTDGLPRTAGGEITTGIGSFNTQRYNATLNTGTLGDHFAFQARLSSISSDGYIDRASADLTSYYVSGEYFDDNTSLKLIHFAGDEVTYQSWWGTPEAKLKGDAQGIEDVINNNGYTQEQAENLRNSGRTFNYYLYDNQVDDYGQDHYQLHWDESFNSNWNLHMGLHYTKGSGFFEEYRNDDDFSDYGLSDLQIGGSTISSTDLIRRRWLDNDFYGVVYDLNYLTDKVQAVLGGAYNEYDGLHFGEIIWAEFANNTSIRERWYESRSDKSDFNTYLKVNYQLTDQLNVYGDAQVRSVNYSGAGNDNDLRAIDFDQQFNFFNPKIGATYQLNPATTIYASFAVGNKEPNRSDIIDAPVGTSPMHETLNNLELGIRKLSDDLGVEVTYYYMDYNNQLVLTGDVNDVGASIRTNVPDSYRMGLEVAANWQITSGLRWNINGTLSENKINSFEEVIFDYGAAFDQFNEVRTTFEDTDISFSPSIIAGSQLTYSPLEGLEFSFLSKYVDDQYLDNTSNEDRKVDAFFVNDLRLNYAFEMKGIQGISLDLLVNNVFNTMYESNGYTFGYFGGPNFEVRENYLYPQAGTNFLLSLGLKF